MGYNMPYGTMQGAPFFNGNMSPQVYSEEERFGIQKSWMANIDPLLRQSQNPDSQLVWQQQQQQQQPIQRFMKEPQRAYFTANLLPTRPQGFSCGTSEPISSLPQATHTRMVSPSPSQELSSTCSSARSPGADVEWFNDSYYSSNVPDDFSLPNAASHFSQGLPDLWTDRSQSHTLPRSLGYSCVKLSQVQTIPDPQEVMFDADEGYIEMDSKTEYAIEVDTRGLKSDNAYTHNYRYYSDEGIGSSIKDEGSPQRTAPVQVDIDVNSISDADADADADGDDDFDHEAIVVEEPSDTEYSPKSMRPRKRRVSKLASPPAVKRGRVTKGNTKSKSAVSCKSCGEIIMNAAALQHHIATAHTRAFVCVFDFAGCSSTFATKNEWKRHVSSQHLMLKCWVCDLGACAKNHPQTKKESNGAVKEYEFNRKDLFTQHLRRMHAPFAVKRMNKKNVDWEEKVKELQTTCLKVRRQPPTRLTCPLPECDMFFDGAACWDDRMEHVAKHLEKAAFSSGSKKFVVEQKHDDLLLKWAMRERIIDMKSPGCFRLCGDFAEKAEDEDADGEDE